MSAHGTIDELLIRWQECRRHGDAPSVRDLCAEHPELAAELARRIAAFESMEEMLGLGPQGPLPTVGPRPAIPPHLAEKLRPLGYELLEVIDQGGMGVVYKAAQTGLRRVVALKMMAGYRVGPKQLARFRVEAEAVARLQHPHIVQVHEVGEVDGHSFFAMEFVEGGNLAHRLADGPLPPRSAAELLEVLARAIHHAHTRGIVHRDLKPANILLENDEGRRTRDESAPGSGSSLHPKVSDFGLAKRLDIESDHTTTGEVIGTPAYMAPEQAQGHTAAIGTACDIYALGAILYECLTGSPPFRANTVLETLRRVISDDPIAPRRVRGDVPRDLEAICLKCLEKNPARRYAGAAALADDLHRFRKGLPIVARRLTPAGRALKWARRHPTRAAVLVLAALGGTAAFARDFVERERHRTEEARRAADEIDRRQKRSVEVAAQAREILHRHCFECHGGDPERIERDFHVLVRSSLLDSDRENVVPGHPEASRLIARIEDDSMPPLATEVTLPRVSALELAILKEWIADGAPEFPPEDPGHPTPPVVPYSALAAEAKEIFRQKCYDCHSSKQADTGMGGIKIMNHDLLLLKRKVVVPGRPEASQLYQLITTPNTVRMMPRPMDSQGRKLTPDEVADSRLSPAEIAKVREWIEAGAPPFPRTPLPKPK